MRIRLHIRQRRFVGVCGKLNCAYPLCVGPDWLAQFNRHGSGGLCCASYFIQRKLSTLLKWNLFFICLAPPNPLLVSHLVSFLFLVWEIHLIQNWVVRQWWWVSYFWQTPSLIGLNSKFLIPLERFAAIHTVESLSSSHSRGRVS